MRIDKMFLSGNFSLRSILESQKILNSVINTSQTLCFLPRSPGIFFINKKNRKPDLIIQQKSWHT